MKPLAMKVGAKTSDNKIKRRRFATISHDLWRNSRVISQVPLPGIEICQAEPALQGRMLFVLLAGVSRTVPINVWTRTASERGYTSSGIMCNR